MSIDNNSILDELDERMLTFENFCIKNKLPFYISVATEHLNPKIKYISRSVNPKELNVELTDDRITKLAASNNKNLKLIFEDEEGVNKKDVGDLYSEMIS